MPVSRYLQGGYGRKLATRIITVDPATRRIEGTLKDGAMVQIRATEVGAVFRWPTEGEVWTIRRDDGYWILDSRIEIPEDGLGDVSTLNPGDTKITGNTLVAGSLSIEGDLVVGPDKTLITATSVFTNEAARDSAIGSPTEGMIVYLTAPTVPAATGATNAVPTGIQTIYNGTVWVCVTSLGAFSNTSANSSSASYVTTLSSDSTAVSVSLVTGTTARIDMTATVVNGTANPSRLSVQLNAVGATDANGVLVSVPASTYVGLGRSYIITGLTAGTNKFTLAYKCGGGLNNWITRNLIVTGVA